ncbi:MAG: hypothetical protein RR702_05130 [Clostridia bacterium]
MLSSLISTMILLYIIVGIISLAALIFICVSVAIGLDYYLEARREKKDKNKW